MNRTSRLLILGLVSLVLGTVVASAQTTTVDPADVRAAADVVLSAADALEALQAENAQLRTTVSTQAQAIEELRARIAELEQGSATHVVPTSIAADCSDDVTAELNAWLASVPDGSTAVLGENGCYRVEGTVLLAGREGFTLDGNGATLRALDDTTAASSRRHVTIDGGSDIVVHDLAVVGTNPDGGNLYVASKETQHGFELRSVSGVVLERVSVTDVYGDFVLVRNDGTGTAPSSDVIIRGSVFARNGRQGIAVTGGDGVVIEHNSMDAMRRAAFDLEPNASSQATSVTIRENQMGDNRLFWIAGGGNGLIRNITVQGNVMAPGTGGGGIISTGAGQGGRGGWLVENNVFRITNSDGSVFSFGGHDGIVIRDNEIIQEETPWRSSMGLVGLTNSHDVSVTGNTALGCPVIFEADAASTNYTASGNVT